MSFKTLRIMGVALLMIAALGASMAVSAKAQAAKPGDAAAGKAVYTTKCVACHKADGSGGMKLTGNPTPNWKDPKTWADPKRKDDAYFRDCITNGKVKSGMVAWGATKQLKPDQIENLIAYIHTFQPKKK